MLTKAYVGGTFDLLHPGHVWLLERVKAQADLVVVSLNTDEFNMRYKRYAPVMTLEERMKMVAALRCVDGVMINEAGENSTTAVLAAARVGNPQTRGPLGPPDCVPVNYVVHGSDWQGPELLKQLGFTDEWMANNKVRMMYIDLSPGYSTTNIRERVIKASKIPGAWVPLDTTRFFKDEELGEPIGL